MTFLQQGSYDGCWELASENLGHLPAADSRTLEPGDSVAGVYDLFNDPENDTCWPSGEHRFTQGYTVDPGRSESAYEWSFTLVI